MVSTGMLDKTKKAQKEILIANEMLKMQTPQLGYRRQFLIREEKLHGQLKLLKNILKNVINKMAL